MRQIIRDLLNHYELTKISTHIQQNIKDSLQIITQRVPEKHIPLGASKIGGLPDLSVHMCWPVWKNKPLNFIAQINLAELPKAEFLKILPGNGMLYFFYAAEQETWGFDPQDKGSWRVIHNQNMELQRHDFPHPFTDMVKFHSCLMHFLPTITLPDSEDAIYAQWDLSVQERERLINFLIHAEQLLTKGDCLHRLLGHPDQIQGEMPLECQLVSNGLYCGDSSGYEDPRAKSLQAGAVNWELLLQVDSDDNTEMMWGDLGKLYYWIPRTALQQADFQAVWMILQCS